MSVSSSLNGLSSYAIRSAFDATTVFASSSLDPLPADLRHGMIAMGIIGLLSSVSTIMLFFFITYRMIMWRKFYDEPLAKNQIFVLIYNLLLADFQQALSFLMAFHWVAEDKLVGPTTSCFAQGWLIQIGDISSGLWVLSIGVHTFINLVLQRAIPIRIFVAWIASLWAFCLFLTSIGPILHGWDFFIPAGAWCWIGEQHEAERLYLHYVWIFLAQIGSIIIYTSVYFVLRSRLLRVSVEQNSAGTSSLSNNGSEEFSKGDHRPTTTTVTASRAVDPFQASRDRIAKAARYMVVYPIAYCMFTMPLAAGRVAAMAGGKVPTLYLVFAGAMMSSCGFIDVVLYISTRKALVKTSVGMKSNKSKGSGLAKFYTRKKDERDAIRMEGLRIPEDESRVPVGTIVVSQSVTMTEDSYGTTADAHPRSDSLRSLVEKKDDGMDGSWLV